jgi:hypothetical protein
MNEKGKQRMGEKKVYRMISGARNHWNRRCASNEVGQTLVLVALAIFVLIGSVALAVDVGYWRFMRRNMQKAADSGAIGGAYEHIYDASNVDFAAKRDTSKNGFTHNENGVNVTVNNPPLNGPHKDLPDKDNYVEVIIEQDQPTFFAKIFGIGSQKVLARAVAYGGLKNNETQADGCIYTLDPESDVSFQVQGENTRVIADDCSIYVSSSSDNCAFQAAGNSTIEAEAITVVGEPCIGGTGTIVDPTPVDNTSAVSNPIPDLVNAGNLPSPWPPPCNYTNTNIQENHTFADNAALNPGVYCGGIRISSAGLTVDFNPGLYILYNGGFRVHAGGSLLHGYNLTFYNTGDTDYGSIVMNANAGTELKATNILGGDSIQGTSPFQEIDRVLFWQDPNNTKAATFNGNSDTIMEGALLFPGADIKFTGGNSTETGYSIIVAQNVKFAGSADFHISNNTVGSGGTPGEGNVVPTVVLVE